MYFSDIDIEEIKIWYGCIFCKMVVFFGSYMGFIKVLDVYVIEYIGVFGIIFF